MEALRSLSVVEDFVQAIALNGDPKQRAASQQAFSLLMDGSLASSA